MLRMYGYAVFPYLGGVRRSKTQVHVHSQRCHSVSSLIPLGFLNPVSSGYCSAYPDVQIRNRLTIAPQWEGEICTVIMALEQN